MSKIITYVLNKKYSRAEKLSSGTLKKIQAGAKKSKFFPKKLKKYFEYF
jgi:hypothetical protein